MAFAPRQRRDMTGTRTDSPDGQRVRTKNIPSPRQPKDGPLSQRACEHSGVILRSFAKRGVSKEEARKWVSDGLMVRDGACAPSHPEDPVSCGQNGLSGSAHVGRLELVAIAGEHAHVTPRRNRTVVSCENN